MRPVVALRGGCRDPAIRWVYLTSRDVPAAHCLTLARLFPGRRVVAFEVDRIFENGGGIHV